MKIAMKWNVSKEENEKYKYVAIGMGLLIAGTMLIVGVPPAGGVYFKFFLFIMACIFASLFIGLLADGAHALKRPLDHKRGGGKREAIETWVASVMPLVVSYKLFSELGVFGLIF